MNYPVLALIVALSSPGPLAAWPLQAADLPTSFERIARVDERSLAATVVHPLLLGFDLDPPGRAVAALVASEDLGKARYVVLVDLQTERARSVRTRESAPRDAEDINVLFTPDGRYLVILEQQQVQVLDVETLGTVRTVDAPASGRGVPVSVCISRGRGLLAVSFREHGRRLEPNGKAPVHVEMVDVADGSRHGSWDAEDLPQSLSPAGTLAAVSTWSAEGPLLKLNVVETRSGRTVATSDGGFRFKKQDAGERRGRVVGAFLGEDEILLGPGGGWDSSGHFAGDRLRIARVRDGSVVAELKRTDLAEYGPTGEMAVSGDGQTIVATSHYLPPWFFTHPHRPTPKGTHPQLLVFSKEKTFRLTGVLAVPRPGGRIIGPTVSFRVAHDGTVLAVEEHYGVTILRRRDR